MEKNKRFFSSDEETLICKFLMVLLLIQFLFFVIIGCATESIVFIKISFINTLIIGGVTFILGVINEKK